MSKILWKPAPEFTQNSNMKKFMDEVNPDFKTYEELYQYSIENIADFWGAFWDFADIRASKPYDRVVEKPSSMPGAEWFPGARLNFAENLLRFQDESIAIIAKTEDQPTQYITYQTLNEKAAHIQSILKSLGLEAGDRVAAYMPNIPETVYAMLASVASGAIWSSCSPDFGTQAVQDRFTQIKPRFLFMTEGYFIKSKKAHIMDRAQTLLDTIPSLEKIIIVTYIQTPSQASRSERIVFLSDIMEQIPSKNQTPEFEQLPFDHPVYIMFSSGTTGKPKCIVQGPGVLLNQLKELILHTDVKRNERIFYFTTCSWMMWNWLVCALGVGASVMLYDGNPLYPEKGHLWKFAQEEKMNVFGTSARYIALMQAMGMGIGKKYDLKYLRAILSTGSPLLEENFEYVYSQVKQDVQLASISGGTDLNGCFALGNPLLPVHSGELQSPGLGMKVEIFNEKSESVREEKGELVCTAAFPSMPLFFWNDPNQEKYKAAYFSKFSGIWHHGDYAMITSNHGLVVYGRSDATLNPGGVRLGTSEIYQQIEKFPDIEDSLVVEQQWKGTGRIILFVVMQEKKTLTEELKKEICQQIKAHASHWHVPKRIIQVGGVPYTYNMKKVEVAVKKIIHGEDVTNKEVLVNPDCLDEYKNLKELT